VKVEEWVLAPIRVVSLNVWKNADWRVYHKEREKWLKYLSLVIPNGVHHDNFRYVSITVYHKNYARFYDQDNLIGGCKPVVDCLKELGWIFDDTRNWVRVWYYQTRIEDALAVGPELDQVTEESTEITLYHSGETPGWYLCPSCYKERWGGTLQDVSPGVFDGGHTGIMCDWCLNTEATLHLQTIVRRLDNGRGRIAREKAVQAKAARAEKTPTIPRRVQKSARLRRRRY